MNIKNLCQGLDILNKYWKVDDSVAAQHDTIYFPPEDASEIISKEDIDKLDKLGFFIDEEYDCIICFT